MSRSWWIPVGGAVLAPLITWLPMLSIAHPGLGLPQYDPAIGKDLWPIQAFWLVALGVLAMLLWTQDRWLSAAVALGGLVIFWRGAVVDQMLVMTPQGMMLMSASGRGIDPTHTLLFALGAVMLVALRFTPRAWHPHVASLLAALGAFQVAYVLQQLMGYDVLSTIGGAVLKPVVQPIGTLGTVDGATAYIAITAPLMPLWIVPFAIFAVWSGHSLSALLALGVGLGVRASRRLKWPLLALAGCGGLAFLSMAYLKGLATPAVAGRFALWTYGTWHAAHSDPILGWGLGGWAGHVPVHQMREGFLPTGELWREAHNEPLQWVTEVGLVGLVLMVGWLWTHRGMFLERTWGPSVSALAANSLGFFPLHVVPLALVGIIVVGLATAHESRLVTP